jgi:amidophosphoribosyltransferase
MSFREECGVFAIWDHEEAARQAFLGLFALQHRGQESAGIVAFDQTSKNEHKAMGLVAEVFADRDLQLLYGRCALGHVRYATTGLSTLRNVQPLTAQIRSGDLALAHNGNLVNFESLARELKNDGAALFASSDSEIFLHLLSRENHADLGEALHKVCQKVEGAYSLCVLTPQGLYAVRDPYGFRPLVLGRIKNEKGKEVPVVASESCAFDLIGARFDREILPGEILCITSEGEKSLNLPPKSRLAQCIFEHVYFSRPDSVVFGSSVYEARKKMGAWLAKESPVKADLVVPVPDSGIPAALGFSLESKIPFELGIVRNHYIGRTFIQPSQSLRDYGVRVKLNPQWAILKDKKVVVIDDSLVRGTTSRKIINLIRQAGAKEVHLRIASPPTRSPCYYGVDTPQKSQLIAAHYNIEEIRQFIGADSLAYLSIEGMFEGLGFSRDKHCAACFDQNYPTPLFNEVK